MILVFPSNPDCFYHSLSLWLWVMFAVESHCYHLHFQTPTEWRWPQKLGFTSHSHELPPQQHYWGYSLEIGDWELTQMRAIGLFYSIEPWLKFLNSKGDMLHVENACSKQNWRGSVLLNIYLRFFLKHLIVSYLEYLGRARNLGCVLAALQTIAKDKVSSQR